MSMKIDLLLFSIYLTAELSEPQRHLIEANHRYEEVGRRLADRQKELDARKESVGHYVEELERIIAWLEEKEKMVLPLKALPANEDEAKEKLKEHMVTIFVVTTDHDSLDNFIGSTGICHKTKIH